MPAPLLNAEFLEYIKKSGVVDPKRLDAYMERLRSESTILATPKLLADRMVRDGLLTHFQAEQFLLGRWRNFIISGKYKLLERLGSGGMGSVFLCEHKVMRRRVAIKILPTSQAEEPAALERFHREARAVAQLHHPNIVGAHDIDQDGKVHFLVMEYVEGSSLQEIIKRTGPMDPVRAAHYMAQAAIGLQAAHEAGLVHRDIKPGNLLIDRSGTMKILDLGLARFFHDEEDNITSKYDETVLGTADYLAPEQAVNSHGVDIRADIYSLGVTFYFLLVGTSPFKEGTVAQKLIWHQMRQPRPIREIRPEVPEGLVAVIDKMMAKDPAQRYQVPIEVAEALSPWTQTPIPPPPEAEMPRLSLAARGSGTEMSPAPGRTTTGSGVSGMPSAVTFQVQQPGGSGSAGGAPPSHIASPYSSGAPETGVGLSLPPGTMVGNLPLPGELPGQSSSGHSARTQDTRALAAGTTAPTQGSGHGSEAGHVSSRRRLADQGQTAPAPDRRLIWMLAALVGVLLAGGAGASIWYTFFRSSQQPVVVATFPASNREEDTHKKPIDRHLQPESFPGKVTIVKLPNNGYQVRGRRYEAVVDPDGCLNSLRVNNVEYLLSSKTLAVDPARPETTTIRGSYFYDDAGSKEVLKLADIQKTDGSIVAESEKASATFEFQPDSMIWKLKNKTDHFIPFYVVFDPARVTALKNARGDWFKVTMPKEQRDPIEDSWQTTTWVADASRLIISGSSKVWGPWPKDRANYQVMEVDLAGQESRELRLDVGLLTEAEAEQVARVTGTKPEVKPEPETVDDVTVAQDSKGYRIHTPRYEALVENDGCLTSLRVGGVELVQTGGSITRGVYLHIKPDETLNLANISKTGKNTLTASGQKGSIQYQFGPDSMKWTATNSTTNQDMLFFVVFASSVTAVRNEDGPVVKPPEKEQAWKTTTWFAGKAKLTMKGSSRIWGGWNERNALPEKHEVWEAKLTHGETREASVEVGFTTEDEAAKIGEVTGVKPVVEPPPSSLPSRGVTIKPENKGFHIQAPRYEAIVAEDGCLPSLKVDGVEFLKPGIGVSRGGYFYEIEAKDEALPLREIKKTGDNVITARSEKASVQYEFGSNTVNLTLKNTAPGRILYFFAFDSAVTKMIDERGEELAVPVTGDWTTTTWIAGKARLKITGSAHVFGPWLEPIKQVWRFPLDPNQTRVVKLEVVGTSENKPPAQARLSMESPQEYQVFQRSSRLKGDVVIRGQAPEGCDQVEARISGKPLEGELPDQWQPVTLDRKGQTFAAPVSTSAGGWFKVEVRALQDHQLIGQATVDHVGLGEVFVIAGQSNSTNFGEELLHPKSGMVSTFSGTDWRLADDPQPGVEDKSTEGSCWPAFGDALYEKYHVPIGVASTGQGATSVSQWQPGGELFEHMMQRIKQLGDHGFRAVLWHQGEQDQNTSTEDYVKLLTNAILESKKQAGWDFPWFVAQVSYRNPGSPSNPALRLAQKKLWDTGVAQEGPDTDTLTGDNRSGGGSGIHLSGKGQRAHGKLWADKVGGYLEKELSR